MNGKRILVTGGAGYIGSHMVLALQEAGAEVIVFDNLSRGHRDAVSGAVLEVGDLCVPEDLNACFSRHPIDLVMHFAGLAYVGESMVDPERYYLTNVCGSANLMASARRHGVQKLVFSSTCATYGQPQYTPLDERHPQSPINPYGRSKLMVEAMLADQAAAYGFSSIALRYFNAAGADLSGRVGERHDPETHLIPLTLNEALRTSNAGDPNDTTLVVHGTECQTPDGTCIRDYVHVTDLCHAHLLAAERLFSKKAGHVEAFNLGNGSGFSVLEIIQACREITGQPILYIAGAGRPGDPEQLFSDSSKASRELGWTPTISSIHTIIESAWRWANRRMVASDTPVSATNFHRIPSVSAK